MDLINVVAKIHARIKDDIDLNEQAVSDQKFLIDTIEGYRSEQSLGILNDLERELDQNRVDLEGFLSTVSLDPHEAIKQYHHYIEIKSKELSDEIGKL